MEEWRFTTIDLDILSLYTFYFLLNVGYPISL